VAVISVIERNAEPPRVVFSVTTTSVGVISHTM